MKFIAGLPLLFVLSLVACGGGGSSTPASISSSSSSSSVAHPLANYPPVDWSEVPPLKSHVDFPIGMEVSAAEQERSIFILTEQQPLLEYHFNSLVAGSIMKMKHLHPQETVYTYEHADELVDYAKSQDMEMHGHTLIWHWDTEIPFWIKNYEGDWETMLNDHVFQIVRHFAGRVDNWDVVNEAIDVVNGVASYRNSIFYQKLGADYIENAFVTAREADPEADLYYNDFNISGNQAKLNFMLEIIDDFQARDIPIDGVGFQMHINVDSPDIAQVRRSFRAVAERGLKIKITELDIAVNRNGDDTFTIPMALEQKERYQEVVTAYMEEVPDELKAGITVWGLVDGETWMLSYTDHEWPLLFNDDYTVKPAFYGFAEGLQSN